MQQQWINTVTVTCLIQTYEILSSLLISSLDQKVEQALRYDCDNFFIFEEEYFQVLSSKKAAPVNLVCPVQRRLLQGSKQKEESVCVPLSHHDALRISVNYCSTALQTHLDMILLMTFLTQGAWGSRQTSCPDLFRVALQHQEEQICSRLDENLGKKQMRSETESWSYMISVSSQWELGGISSTLPMWRPMGRLSVWMQRQCCSTPRLRRLIPIGRQQPRMLTKCNSLSRNSNACRAAQSDMWKSKTYHCW